MQSKYDKKLSYIFYIMPKEMIIIVRLEKPVPEVNNENFS